MITNYDLEIDSDCDGADFEGTATINGRQSKLQMVGSGRDLEIEIDGERCPNTGELRDFLEMWTDPLDAVEEVLKKHSLTHCENLSARVVNGNVVKLLVIDGRKIKIVRGVLSDGSRI